LTLGAKDVKHMGVACLAGVQLASSQPHQLTPWCRQISAARSNRIGKADKLYNIFVRLILTKIIKIVATREEERREGKGGTGKGPASIYGPSS